MLASSLAVWQGSLDRMFCVWGGTLDGMGEKRERGEGSAVFNRVVMGCDKGRDVALVLVGYNDRQ